MTGFRGEDAKRMRRYISQTARATDPLANETLGAYLDRVGKIVKDRFAGPKSISPVTGAPAVVTAVKLKEKRKKRDTPSAEANVLKMFSTMHVTSKSKSPAAVVHKSPSIDAAPTRKVKRAKAPSPTVALPDPMDDMMKLFASMNMTKTTKRNAIAARPVVRTSRQTAVALAKVEEKKKRAEESRRLKELADKKRTLRAERKKTKAEADSLADLFNFKLGGGGRSGQKKH